MYAAFYGAMVAVIAGAVGLLAIPLVWAGPFAVVATWVIFTGLFFFAAEQPAVRAAVQRFLARRDGPQLYTRAVQAVQRAAAALMRPPTKAEIEAEKKGLLHFSAQKRRRLRQG